MGYRCCLYTNSSITADGRRCRRFPAAAYTGVVGDTRFFAIFAPVDLMSPAWAPASQVTGNATDGGVIELYPVTEKPSDVPLANFVVWTPPSP
jgi:hypothetical protein